MPGIGVVRINLKGAGKWQASSASDIATFATEISSRIRLKLGRDDAIPTPCSVLMFYSEEEFPVGY